MFASKPCQLLVEIQQHLRMLPLYHVTMTVMQYSTSIFQMRINQQTLYLCWNTWNNIAYLTKIYRPP